MLFRSALWPCTVIRTAALAMIPGLDIDRTRTPDIMADAAYLVLNRDARAATGNFYLDETVLRESGITDFTKYAVAPEKGAPYPDLFL